MWSACPHMWGMYNTYCARRWRETTFWGRKSKQLPRQRGDASTSRARQTIYTRTLEEFYDDSRAHARFIHREYSAINFSIYRPRAIRSRRTMYSTNDIFAQNHSWLSYYIRIYTHAEQTHKEREKNVRTRIHERTIYVYIYTQTSTCVHSELALSKREWENPRLLLIKTRSEVARARLWRVNYIYSIHALQLRDYGSLPPNTSYVTDFCLWMKRENRYTLYTPVTTDESHIMLFSIASYSHVVPSFPFAITYTLSHSRCHSRRLTWFSL